MACATDATVTCTSVLQCLVFSPEFYCSRQQSPKVVIISYKLITVIICKHIALHIIINFLWCFHKYSVHMCGRYGFHNFLWRIDSMENSEIENRSTATHTISHNILYPYLSLSLVCVFKIIVLCNGFA